MAHKKLRSSDSYHCDRIKRAGKALVSKVSMASGPPPPKLSEAPFRAIASQQQPAKAQENQLRPSAQYVPQQARRLVARDLAQGFPRRRVEKINQPRVVSLLKMVHRSPQQPVRAEFPPQRQQFAPATLAQNGLRHGLRSPEAGDDAAYRGYFHLPGGVPHQVHVSLSNLALNRHPPPVHRNPRALPFQRFHTFLFQERCQAPRGLASVLANNAQSSAFMRFRTEPVEVRSVVRHEPHSRGVRRSVLRQPHNRLDQRDGFKGGA